MAKPGSRASTSPSAEINPVPAIRCTRCQAPYPVTGVPYLCPQCGGVFDYDGPPVFDPQAVEPHLPGMWRYRASFGLPEGAPVISLGEGSTLLIQAEAAGRTVMLKMESQNPTGSYKDRGSAVLLSQLYARGVIQAVEDSSGNAGASYAAYAARAGVRARVFVPESASGPKRGQIEAYGADLVAVPGPRSAAAEAVLKEVRDGAVYASHAYLPFGLPGIATIAYELYDQMDGQIGTVIAPAGHGGLLLGVLRGFEALLQGGQMEKLPHFIGVQAAECAPMAAAYADGMQAIEIAAEGPTVAEGVRVRRPVRAEAILNFLQKQYPGSGRVIGVPEEAIMPAYTTMARMGVHVEPTSALAWAALQQVSGKVPEPIILILSGAGLKYRPA